MGGVPISLHTSFNLISFYISFYLTLLFIFLLKKKKKITSISSVVWTWQLASESSVLFLGYSVPSTTTTPKQPVFKAAESVMCNLFSVDIISERLLGNQVWTLERLCFLLWTLPVICNRNIIVFASIQLEQAQDFVSPTPSINKIRITLNKSPFVFTPSEAVGKTFLPVKRHAILWFFHLP